MSGDATGVAAAAAPRLKQNLTIQPTEAGRASVVKDPASGSFYRLGEVEQFIIQQLDGRTPLDEVRRRTEEKFAASLSPEALDTFIRRLQKQGLLETDAGPGAAALPPAARVRGSLLYFRVPIVNPDRVLGWLAARTGLLYTRAFFAVSCALIVLALGVVIFNASTIAFDLTRLYKVAAIPVVILVYLAVITAHEFAHGVTCKHYGGEVREMGFMLMYFAPAFYSNVSDAWLFPEKSKRLWVSFAGAYFELFIWALATLAWQTTEPDTWVSYVALIVMAISGIKSFLNLNPFIKLDGYYLLSDYLEIPNLRARAFRYLGASIRRSWGAGPGPAEDVSARDRRVYLVYGTFAAVGSLCLLSWAFVRAGGMLIDLGQPLALLALTWLVAAKYRLRLRALFGRSSARPKQSHTEAEDDEEGNVQSSAGPRRLSKATVKRVGEKLKRVPLKAWALAAIGVFVLLIHVELRVPGPFNVLPEENADVRAAVEGIVEAVYVGEGDSVRAGAVVARLSDRTIRMELSKIEAELREAQTSLRRLRGGSTAEEIGVARAGVSRAKDRLSYAHGKLSRLKGLFEMGSATRQELEDAEEAATTAENDVDEATGKLKVLLRSQPEEIEANTARLDRLETERRYLEEQLGLLDIVSPVSGIVATPTPQLRAMERQLVSRGALIAKVYDFSSVTAQIVVPEKEIADVRVGQPVVLKARAYPDAEFIGTVTAIATSTEGSASMTAGMSTAGLAPVSGAPSQKFIVTTRIDNRSYLLKPGMTGQAKVLGGERRVIGLINRRLVRTFKVQFWSWW